MKSVHAVLFVCVAMVTTLPGLLAGERSKLSAEEKKAGFESLFDGSEFDGWKQSGNWIIDGDAMSRSKGGGGIAYTAKKIPDDFELRFEWKVGKGSNSGVYYRPGQYEYQILDNKVHADGKNPRTSAASIYFCMAPSRDATKPVGEWNAGRIVCKGTVVQHWLNGEKVIDFDYTDKKWAFNVDLLKKRGAELSARGANLSLQDHGDPVWYRNIRLRSIPKAEKVEQTDVSPAEIPVDVLEAERKKLDGIVKRREAARQKSKNK